ncbi:MAG: hypothetical protein ACRESU_07850 [Gammaproteobacteria bacterium]
MTSTVSTLHRDILPAARQAGWRRWLVALALICVVGVYSIELTHDHETAASELACPVCHVMAHGAPNLFKPSLSPTISFIGWYLHVLPLQGSSHVHTVIRLRPEPRAPPVPAISNV